MTSGYGKLFYRVPIWKKLWKTCKSQWFLYIPSDVTFQKFCILSQSVLLYFTGLAFNNDLLALLMEIAIALGEVGADIFIFTNSETNFRL